MNVGDKAPELLGINEKGEEVRLNNYKGRKIVLYFYPKDNTSGCTAQACSLRDNYAELRKAGYEVIGVSVDNEKSHQKFIEKNNLPFTLIADTDKKLVIAGGSSDTSIYMNRLKKMASEDERIIFTGFVQGKMLEELYSNALIYCLPSDLEGMPLSLLEAMSYGNCCLTSNISECAEVVEDKAVTFEKGNVNDLKKKIERLLSHEEEIKKYKKQAADFICTKYNWDNVVEETIKVYQGEKENG